ncbi:hypothetical protein ACIBTV_25415 [Micromonospora sp. NPDC049366]|uniref:hypothetical protein n=1 Tax=Micromonospora sp. NPDC049366 TaxID=3364271 RepID=UPI00378C0A7C
MGYSYGRTPAGRQGLACDKCGKVGGVRKRKCPYTVTGDNSRSPDGKRHALPYCPAPAVCPECWTKLKPTAHAECKEGAARRQAEEDAKQARLDSGDLIVLSAVGDWHEGVPTGMVRVTFGGPAWSGHRDFLMPKDVYKNDGWLSDYPQAVPADACDHQPGQPACERPDCGGTPPITTPFRAYDVSVEPRATECGADQTVRDLARAVGARTGLPVSALRAGDNGWADVNRGGRKINGWDFKVGPAQVRVLTYEARHALSRDPLLYAAAYVGQTCAAGAVDMVRRPDAWKGEIVRAVTPIVESLYDAVQVATPAPIQGWSLKSPIIGSNVQHNGLGLVEVAESRGEGYTLLVKDAAGRDHYIDRMDGWWKVYPGGAAVGGVDTPERYARRIAYRDHVMEWRHAKLADANVARAKDCPTCLSEVTGAPELGTGHVWGRYVRFPWCLLCGTPATLTAATTARCPGTPGGDRPAGLPDDVEPEVGRAAVAGEIRERVSQAPDGLAAPRMLPTRDDRRAKRGDVLVIEKRTQVGTRDGRGAVEVRYEVHEVISATRDGEPKRVRDLGWGREYNIGKHDRRDFQASRRQVIPGDLVDVDALHQALKAHTYPNSTTPKRPETRAEVHAFITPHLVEPGVSPPKITAPEPEPAAPVAVAVQPDPWGPALRALGAVGAGSR